MRLLITAIAAIALAGTGIAAAQTGVSTGAGVKAEGAVNADANAKASAHTRKHRATTGRGGIETRDNNASARGSLLPGKDRLNSKAFIEDH